MKVLLVSATELEIKEFGKLAIEKYGSDTQIATHDVNYFISGVGMLPMAANLSKHLASNNYDVAINIGIIGAIKGFSELGEVVEVIQDQVYMEGAEDGEKYRSIYELGLRGENDFPFDDGMLKSTYCHESLPQKKARAITLNLVHGNNSSVDKFTSSKIAEVESMEGAAFFYACHQFDLKCAQIKSVSNFIEERNKDNWNIDLALNNLASALIGIIEKI